MRLQQLFQKKNIGILNIYFTAGFPEVEDTRPLLKAIQDAGADIAEIGVPFSDPVADGETIQMANTQALQNGMSVELLFQQLEGMRDEIHIPVILMGDINPIIQFGPEKFCKACQKVGIDGLIIPNLPLDEYVAEFKDLFEEHGLSNIFLITPQTSEERILQIDSVSHSFIYMVSSFSTTGSTSGISAEMEDYFRRVNQLPLRNPKLIGFGIKDKKTFQHACKYANGAIIGSALIRTIQEGNPTVNARDFVHSIID